MSEGTRGQGGRVGSRVVAGAGGREAGGQRQQKLLLALLLHKGLGFED